MKRHERSFSNKKGLWLDAEIDGFHHTLQNRKTSPNWDQFITQFPNSELINRHFIQKPEKNKIEDFSKALLDECNKYRPSWITVPQLPITDTTERNKVNKLLVESAVSWRSKTGFSGRLVFPVIFTHFNQIERKTEWGKTLGKTVKILSSSGIDLIWVVHSELCDWRGSGPNSRRMESLIDFHKDLRDDTNSIEIIAGPYWGLNLVLWSRQLCDYPAIRLGSGFQYMISGGVLRKGNSRIALPPLKRLVTIQPELRSWLERTMDILSETDPAYKSFSYILQRFDNYYANEELAKDQVNKYYSEWIDFIENSPPSGRQIALYQQLSSAYVLAKQLSRKKNTLPKSEAPARHPEKIAEQLMLLCL